MGQAVSAGRALRLLTRSPGMCHLYPPPLDSVSRRISLRWANACRDPGKRPALAAPACRLKTVTRKAIYTFSLRRRTPASPKALVPKRINVPGSGAKVEIDCPLKNSALE
jgi:hypothetical protein